MAAPYRAHRRSTTLPRARGRSAANRRCSVIRNQHLRFQRHPARSTRAPDRRIARSSRFIETGMRIETRGDASCRSRPIRTLRRLTSRPIFSRQIQGPNPSRRSVTAPIPSRKGVVRVPDVLEESPYACPADRHGDRILEPPCTAWPPAIDGHVPSGIKVALSTTAAVRFAVTVRRSSRPAPR